MGEVDWVVVVDIRVRRWLVREAADSIAQLPPWPLFDRG